MKRKLVLICLLLIVLSAFVFVACENATDDNVPSGKSRDTVPTYQGMTITRLNSTMTSSFLEAPRYLGDGSEDVTTTQGESSLDEDEPATEENLSSTDDAPTETLETDPHTDHVEELSDEIEDLVTITVESDDEVKYYVRPNERFIIQVHISNPDDFEIQSFTLNGKKYANYMFKEGSTMELLLLEVDAPATSGYTSYSIDAIKYIDGTEIKDVDMSKGEKSIKAGIAYTNPPRANAEVKNLSTTSFSLDVTVVDEERLIGSNELAVYLSNGEKVIDTKPLKVGKNTVTFDDLTMSTLYEYGVVTAFDLIDGRDTQIVWLTTDTVSTLGAYTIKDVTSTQDSISFAVERTGEVGTIDSISLYDATTKAMIKSGSAEIREFDNLLSNHSYHIYVDFSYMIGGEKVADWVTVKNVKTVAKSVPSFEIENLVPTQTSFVYEINVTDSDKVGAITEIELLHGDDEPVLVEDLTSREFTKLLSNNDYSVKVTYTYDLNDGVGKQTLVKTASVKTVAKAVPSFDILNDAVTDTSINASYAMTDPDGIGGVLSVSIYKGDVLALTNEDKYISFSGLDYYTAYRLVLAYSYDANDGNGVVNASYEKDYRTTPHVVFTSCKISNTSAVSEGETIYLQASIENPNKATCIGVVVNGRTYGVVGTTTAKKVFVEIVSEGQFEGGDTVLTVEKLLMTLDDADYEVTPANENNSDHVFINGKLELLSVDYVDAEGEPLGDWVYPDAEVYVMMTLKNPTDYVIDAIDGTPTADYNGFTKLDKNHYLWRASISHGTNSVGITTIDYHNDYLVKSTNQTTVTHVIYCTADSEVHYVSTPADLKNMASGYHYVLAQDVDLQGIEWSSPADFCGVFDGNGHAVKNMSFVGTIKNPLSDVRLGLFAGASGVIFDLEVKEALYIVSIERENEDWCYLSLGGIASYVKGTLVMENCVMDEESIFSINVNGTSFGNNSSGIGGILGATDGSYCEIKNCQNQATVSCKGNIRVGGICGNVFNILTITNCTNSGNVSGESYVGGICGYGYYNLTITNCTNSGNVSGEYYVGGICGSGHGYENTAITNCANMGAVSGSRSDVGGICGYAYEKTSITNCLNGGTICGDDNVGGICGELMSPSAMITNCTNFGVVSGHGDAGGIRGSADHNSTITNCYDFSSTADERMNEKSFYTEVLGWDEEIWDLDVANGKLPTLR